MYFKSNETHGLSIQKAKNRCKSKKTSIKYFLDFHGIIELNLSIYRAFIFSSGRECKKVTPAMIIADNR